MQIIHSLMVFSRDREISKFCKKHSWQKESMFSFPGLKKFILTIFDDLQNYSVVYVNINSQERDKVEGTRSLVCFSNNCKNMCS